jgi:hypothetical protein
MPAATSRGLPQACKSKLGRALPGPLSDLRQACPRPVVFTAIGYQYVGIEKQQQTVIACFAARGYKGLG